MSALRVKFETAALAATVEARYRCGDFSLVYAQRRQETPRLVKPADVIEQRFGIRRDTPFLACADTLVLTFVGEARELAGVDAYTNWQHWKRVGKLELPRTSGVGRICLAEKLDDDRIDLGVVPKYTYSGDQRLLRISIAARDLEPLYHRVSDRLIVGVSGGNLALLFVESLSIER